MNIRIPESIEAATAALEGVGALLTAKEWERAAIVYAFTRDGGSGSRTDLPTYRRNALGLTTGEFAALGITGLKSDTTVRDYRKAWQTVIDDGQAVAVAPGDTIEMPDRGFPPNPKQHSSTPPEVISGIRKLLLDDPDKAIRDIVKGEPEVISALARGVREHPALQSLVAPRMVPSVREVEPTFTRDHDYSQDLRYAVNGLLRVLSAMRDGKWEPDEMETTLLTFLRQAFAEITNEPETTTYNVIDEIEAFLVTQS